MEKFKIGAVTSISNTHDFSGNFNKMSHYLKEAALKGCSLVVFPEMNLTGYTTGNDLKDSAIEIDNKLKKSLTELNKLFNVSFLCGLAEKSGNKIYATHLLIDRSEITGKYRKIQPGPPELPFISPGNSVGIFDFNGWKTGVQLCYDSHFPEISTYMGLMGTDILFIPHASPRGSSREKLKSWERHLSARAYDNGFYLLAVNQCGQNNKGLGFPGIAVLFSPSGTIAKSHLSKEEDLFCFEIDKKEVEEVRNHRMKNFLKFRRHDFYNQLFNNSH